MGNSGSSIASNNSREAPSRVFFLFQRTWAVVLTDKWTKKRLMRRKKYRDNVSDVTSQFTFCNCSQCQPDYGFGEGSIISDFFCSEPSMSPNSINGGLIKQQWGEDSNTKEKQRPPIYNPEDYALSLRKWGRRSPANGQGLYNITTTAMEIDNSKIQSNTFRDYRNPMLTSSGCEMTLRQFGNVTDLLSKLRNDLRLSYPSFVQEFVAEPVDGVTLLLEVLRAIQLSQANNASNTLSGTTGKIPPTIQRRALLDELACLQCLLCCCSRYTESIRKLTASSAGLFTLSVCIMSNVNKSRIIALQLLTKSCEPSVNANSSVSEAMSTLRLRFGEPVRFRFLVGMLTSAGGQGELLATGLKFLNTFLDTTGSLQNRLYVQAELEQAGFSIDSAKKNISINSQYAELIFSELHHMEKKHVDVETLNLRLEDAEKENDALRDKVLLLERRVQILQEEKGILMSLEQCLKDRCSELQDEVVSLKSPKHDNSDMSDCLKRDGSSPEDEGISSSDRSLTPDELQRESSEYEMYSVQNETLPLKDPSIPEDDKEDETTIEEVIEELHNIINDAETQDFQMAEFRRKEVERARIEEAQVRGKIQMRVDSNVSIDDSCVGSESEIVPSNLHPQPPRKTRSLVHLYIPTEEYYNKEIFFENETAYTSDESSDSLLSASRCQVNNEKDVPLSNANDNNNRSILNTIMDVRDKRVMRQLVQPKILPRQLDDGRKKSKSLDRIDDGLDTMVDIVVTEKVDQNNRSDSGNVTITTLSRTYSNIKNKLGQFENPKYENPKMFLPAQNTENRYYFPRLQEKRATNSSFLVKRGHGNAGMYSGQNITIKKNDYYATSGSKNSSSKLTDYPSGLY